MRTKIQNLFVLLLLSTNSICAATDLSEYTKIECTVSPMFDELNEFRPGVSKPRDHIKESTSNNWAGYVAATSLSSPKNHTVSFVNGTWTIPTLFATPDNSYSSTWVGIDGFQSTTVEQIGTESDWDIVQNKQVNYAWFEMYPDYAYLISNFPIKSGDSITGEVEYTGNNTFSLTLVNNTTKVYYTVPTKYTKSKSAKRLCAEWVVEAPWMNGVLQLANFGTTSLSDCTATINDVTGSISDAHWSNDVIAMASEDGVVKAVTSELSNKGKNFSVTWVHE